MTPVYEYRCKCGRVTHIYRLEKDRLRPFHCPACRERHDPKEATK